MKHTYSFLLTVIALALLALALTAVASLHMRLTHEADMAYALTASASIDRLAADAQPRGAGTFWLWLLVVGMVLTSMMTASSGLLGKGGVNGLVRQFKRKRSRGGAGVNARPYTPMPVNVPGYVLAGEGVNDSVNEYPLLESGVNDGVNEEEYNDVQWSN